MKPVPIGRRTPVPFCLCGRRIPPAELIGVPALSPCPECGGTARRYEMLRIPLRQRIAYAWKAYLWRVECGAAIPPLARAEILFDYAVALACMVLSWRNLYRGHPALVLFFSPMALLMLCSAARRERKYGRQPTR